MAESISIPDQTLVVVADGHQAILFRAHGSNGKLSLSEQMRLTPKSLADDGPSGSRPEEQTSRQTDEATFVKQLANDLFRRRDANEFQHLVVAADPQTLGQLRDTMHKIVSESIIISLDKELTNHSVSDIATIIDRAAN
ncbi:host attachment family protein [Devosia sp. CAU 1758]